MEWRDIVKKLLLVSLVALLAACGNDETTSTEKEEMEETEEKEVVATESEHPFPSDVTPIGDATIMISTPAGTTEEGNIPVLYVSEDDILTQIGIDYENFDGSVETFVYINKIFNTSEQVGELTQSSLDLYEDNLTPGDYTVTAVQFTGNDTSNKPINLTQAQFKIEEGS